MREIPEKTDLAELSKACDRVMKHMRLHHDVNDPDSEVFHDLEAMAYICKFIYKIKDNIEFLENTIQILKASKSEGRK